MTFTRGMIPGKQDLVQVPLVPTLTLQGVEEDPAQAFYEDSVVPKGLPATSAAYSRPQVMRSVCDSPPMKSVTCSSSVSDGISPVLWMCLSTFMASLSVT
jgi:hypothetical protein